MIYVAYQGVTQHTRGWVHMRLRSRGTAATLAALAIAAAAAVAGCAGKDDCSDGDDNDADGRIDAVDPGCAFNGDIEAPDPDLAACGDGVDNDGDGAVDLDDQGCESALDPDEYDEPVAGCRDGVDNDGDELLDYPNDPGCLVSLDDDEEDSCPNGSACAACSNGVDDDGDDILDYPEDLGCDSASDGDEFNADPTVCGANVPVQPLPDDGMADGFFDDADPNQLISLECGGSGTESVYLIEIEAATTLIATTDFPETGVDTVLYLRSQCRESSSEIECNDDVGEATASRIQVADLAPGTYYLIVDARQSGLSGAFRLQVQR